MEEGRIHSRIWGHMAMVSLHLLMGTVCLSVYWESFGPHSPLAPGFLVRSEACRAVSASQ